MQKRQFHSIFHKVYIKFADLSVHRFTDGHFRDGRMKRVAIYTRVSTEDQAKEGFSLDAQMEKLRAYCSARGWEIVKEYVDNGYSGRDINRPAYKKMMEEIDEWDMLLVMKMDRIHRNSKNFMMMMENLNEKGKEFVSMTESLDTSTAMGRFVMDIIQRIAQLESEQIGERVYVGMRQKAKDGKGVLGSPAPYGYEYKNGELAEVEGEINTVRKIYDMYLEGKSLGDIVKWLESEGIRTKRGGKWNKKTVSRILSNPIYCGLIEWEDIISPGKHKGVVSMEEFNKVQRIKHRRARRKGENFVINNSSNSFGKDIISQ